MIPDLRRSLRSSVCSALLGVAIASLLPSVSNAAIEFRAPTAFGAGAPATSIVLGDLDGDLRPDAVVSQGASGITTLRQASDVTFSVLETLASEPSVDLALLDVDGDADLDLAVARADASGLHVLLNDGSGHFTFGAEFMSGGSDSMAARRQLATGDLDGDGDLDLVMSGDDASGNCVYVFMNTGAGLASPTREALISRPFDVVTGDVDQDGDVDIVTSGSQGQGMLLNQGGGAFQRVSGGYTTYGAIALGDLDGDGDLDLSAAIPAGSVQAFLNTGNAQFVDQGLTPLYGRSLGLVAQDLDHDGDADLATTSFDLQTVTIRRSHGDGTFEHPTLYFSTGSPLIVPHELAVADLDGDGEMDIVTANTSGNAAPGPGCISVYRGGFQSECGRQDLAAGPGASYVEAADFDADGIFDVAVVNEVGVMSVKRGLAGGGFGASEDYAVGTLSQTLAVADLDADSRPDLLCVNYDQNNVSVFRNLGDGTMQSQGVVPTGWHPRFVATADLNGDGAVDMVTGDYHDAIEAGSITVRFNNGTGGFGAPTTYVAGVGCYEVSIADLNGDQSPDLVVNNYDEMTISVYINNGSGHFAPQVRYATGWSLSSALADLDHDGDRDIAVANFKEGTVGILRNQGNGTFSAMTSIVVGAWPRSIVATRLNSDGHTDLAVAMGGVSQIMLLRNDGTGVFQLTGTCQIGVNPKCVLAIDVDKNGGLDLVTANPGSGSVSILSDVAPAWSSPAAIANAKRPRNLNPRGEAAVTFALAPAAPNPVVDGTLLRFSIPAAAHVELSLFDVAGREVQVVVDRELPAGEHVVEWKAAGPGGARLAAGLYFCRLRAGGSEATRSLIVR